MEVKMLDNEFLGDITALVRPDGNLQKKWSIYIFTD